MCNNKYYFSVKEDHCSGKKFSDGIPVVLQNDFFHVCFKRVWLHQGHTNKWKLLCCLLVIRQNKKSKFLQFLYSCTMDVLQRDVTLLKHPGVSWTCSRRVNVRTINCTWRLKTDSQRNSIHARDVQKLFSTSADKLILIIVST